jgi:hypothetical protein
MPQQSPRARRCKGIGHRHLRRPCVCGAGLSRLIYNLYNTKSVVALNTFGYVKHTISKLEQIDGWNFDNKHGIYIKKPDTNIFNEVAQGALVVVGVLVCTTTKWIKKQLASRDYPIENYIIINNDFRTKINTTIYNKLVSFTPDEKM